MSFSQADYIAMQMRLQKNLRPAVRAVEGQRETGKGGIQDEIESYFKSLGSSIWYDVKRTDVRTTSRIGVPDFVGVYCGTAFGMEVKRPGNKPTTEQLGELKWMELAGAKTGVVHSIAEARNFLAEFFKVTQ